MRILLTLCMLLTFSLSIQAQNWNDRVKGEGPTVTRDLDISSFEAISLATSGKLYITQGSPQAVRVEAQANIIDLIKTEVKDGRWRVDFKSQVYDSKDVIVYVTVPKLSAVSLSGSGDIIGKNQLNQAADFSTKISGSGNIDLDVKADNLYAGISGSGNLKLKGASENFAVKISGSGDVKAFDIASENVDIKISGSGDVQTTANENLQVKVSGSGDVYYKGRPRVQTKISGSGDLINKGSGS